MTKILDSFTLAGEWKPLIRGLSPDVGKSWTLIPCTPTLWLATITLSDESTNIHSHSQEPCAAALHFSPSLMPQRAVAFLRDQKARASLSLTRMQASDTWSPDMSYEWRKGWGLLIFITSSEYGLQSAIK